MSNEPQKNDITINFGKNLKKIRKSRKFSQEKLAQFLGITLRHVARLEAGESFISAETLDKLCTIFEIQPAEFFVYL